MEIARLVQDEFEKNRVVVRTGEKLTALKEMTKARFKCSDGQRVWKQTWLFWLVG